MDSRSDCEMSLRTSLMSSPTEEMMEELQSRSSPVTSKFIACKKSLMTTSSPTEVPSPAAFIDYEMSPWTPKVEWIESQSSSYLVSFTSTDHNYNVPQKKRKGLTTVPPISQPAQPLRKWEIADFVNIDYGSEDDSDNDDGKDGRMFPMSSVLPRTQRAWMSDLLEEELSETQSSAQMIAQEDLPPHAPSTSQLASPPEVLAQEALTTSSQLATTPEVEISSSITLPTQNSSRPLSQGITESPISLWEFHWKSFSEHTVPPPRERMEHFDQPTGPVRSFETAFEVFTAIWNTEILSHIVEQTNAYAQLITARQMEEGTLQHLSRLCNWKDLTIDELQVYFALLIAMGLVCKSSLREYWASQGDITDTPNFGKYMSVNRFANITRTLHFNDNCDPQLHTLPKPQAKLFKIQPILNHLNHKFQELYRLSREIALDESLTEWKGWLDINQFMKSKSAKIGVKSYEICDSRTGYLWKFKVHAGREATEEQDISPVSGVTSKIVLEMVHDLEHRGHILFMDNFYNSPALTRCLKTKGFDVVGTLRPNRQLVPAEFRIKKTQMTPGEIYGATSGDVDIVVWRDQNKVCMISTYHGMTQFRRDGVQKLSVVHDYNVCMGGVDRKDQMLSMYPLERKRTQVWYKKLFRRLFNVSILNAYIILKHTSDRLQHRQFSPLIHKTSETLPTAECMHCLCHTL